MKKFKNPKSIFILFLITIIGLFFRLWHIDKGGLWFDELHCYYQASSDFPFEIFRKAFLVDAHAPLYYYILRFWMELFGNADVTLRYLSVLFGVLNIPAAYFAAKEISTKKAALIAAGLFSINSFLIYYSQEIKFYSLLALCATLIIWSLAKINNSKNLPDKLVIITLAICNLTIIYTFTIGIIFVFIELLIFAIYILFYKKKLLKKFLINQVYTGVLALPFIYGLIYRFMSGNFLYTWKYHFIPKKLLFNLKQVLFAFFSPIYEYSGMINIFVLLSIFIILTFIFIGIEKNKFKHKLFFIGIIYFLATLTLIAMEKLNFMARYFILALPFFLILSACGFAQIKNKILKVSFLTFILVINISFLLTSPNSTPKLPRVIMAKPIVSELQKFNLTKDDVIIFPSYLGVLLPKYLHNVHVFDFYTQELMHIRYKKFYPDSLIKNLNSKNMYEEMRKFVNAGKPSDQFYEFVNTNALKKVKRGHHLLYILDETLYKDCLLANDFVNYITSNKDLYNETITRGQLEYLVSTKFLTEIYNLLKKQLSFEKIIRLKVFEDDKLQTFYIMIFVRK